jgi:putative transposase
VGEKAWIPVAEAAELEKVSQQRIRELISNGQIMAKKVKTNKGGPGGQQWLVDPLSLSTPAKSIWLKRQEAAVLIETDRNWEKEQTTLALGRGRSGKRGKRTGAVMDENETINPAAYRDTVGEEVYNLEMDKARQRQYIVKKALDIMESREHVTERMKALAEETGKNVATIYRWIEKEKQSGVYGLMRQRPTVTAGKEFRAISAEVETLIRKFYQAPGEPKAAAAYRKTCALCRQLNLPEPSRATVFRFIEHLEQIEPDVCCYTRRGEEAWRRQFAPHGVRQEPDRVMQIVMGDHHKFDDFIEYGGRPVRPWVTMWLDVKSRCPVGWTVSVQANGQTIGLALANMMRPKKRTVIKDGQPVEEVLEMGGIPETLYIDNGEDYKSKLKKGLASKDFEMSRESLDLCAYLGVKVVFATPYHPQAKAHIERFFGTVAMQFSREQPGWCGSKPSERPDGFDEYKLCEAGKLLDLVEFSSRFADWIYHTYLENVHSGIHEKPLAKHLAGPKLNPGWPDPRTLDILRCVKEEALVYKEGIKRFKRYYWHEKLDALAGQYVIIRFDPAHIGEIDVYTKNGGFICMATNLEYMRYGACQDDIKKLQKRKKEQKQRLRQRLAETEQDYQELEDVIAERVSAGQRSVDAPAASSEGLLPAITPLDQAGRQAAKAKSEKATGKDKKADMAPTGDKPESIDLVGMIMNRKYG